jgi:TonB family protein
MFSTLDFSNEGCKRRGVAFTCGLFIQVLLTAAVVFIGALLPRELSLSDKHYLVTWLPALTPAAQPISKHPRGKSQVLVPKLKLPDKPGATEIAAARLVVPTIRPTISSARVNLPEPLSLPPAPVAQPANVTKAEVPMRIGVYGVAAEPASTKRPAETGEVQTGGFGSSVGLASRTERNNPGNVQMQGAFGPPDGSGEGNGAGGRRGMQGLVASAGFGSGTAGTGYGPPRGGNGGSGVTMGGFEKVAQVTNTPRPSQLEPQTTDFQPVEILSKPSPVYTEDARRRGIQGEVVLSVVFQASGGIKVVAVVKSLGDGLDEAAEQAATQILFRPALRGGKPTDFPATLRTEFRLADHST